MIFFCNFALIMRQRFFQPVISLLFAALLMTGCGGKGSVKPLSITLDSIVIDTTATLEKDPAAFGLRYDAETGCYYEE